MSCWPVPASARLSAPIHATRPRKIHKMFFRSTNMRPRDAMVQLLQKHNWMVLLRDGPQHSSGMMIDLCTQLSLLCTSYILQYILQVTCGNCNGAGHYHLTCEAECRWCGFKTYKAHLSSASEEEPLPRLPLCQQD